MPVGGAPVTPVDKSGNVIGTQGATVASPEFNRNIGAPTVATNQTASSLSPAAAAQIVAARSGRQSVMITNITGTQPVYLGASGVTVSTGLFLAGSVGASVTIVTSAAIFATSPTAAQTLSYLENY